MLIKLMAGVLSFKKIAVQMQDLLILLDQRQSPDTVFVTCCDSRVIPNLITQGGPGDLFELRNIGNIIPPYPSLSREAAALEYAFANFDIKDIIICGHSQCGAMKGLLTPDIGTTLPAVSFSLGDCHAVLKSMNADGSIHLADPAAKLTIATKRNILQQIEHLKTYPFIAKKLANNELTIHGWLYDVGTGKVRIYDPEQSDFIKLKAALSIAIEKRKNKIVTQIAMNTLELLAQTEDAEELRALIQLVTRLEKNIEPIWPVIKRTVHQRLWSELGIFYSKAVESDFLALVESGAKIKLPELKKIQKKIVESQGCHDFCSRIIHASFFSPAPKRLAIQTEQHKNLNAACSSTPV